MKDFDWFSSTYIQPDIYSESRSRFYSTYINSHFGYTPSQTPHITYGIGYLYSISSWTCSDTIQSYPSNPSQKTKTVKGPTLTYRLDQSIPYFDFSISHQLNKSLAKLTLGMAPYLMISDNDNHILRSKRAISNDAGYGHWISAEFTRPISDRWILGATLTHKTISAWGKQRQFRYKTTTEGPPGFISDIDHSISIDSYAMAVNMTYRWESLDLKTPPASYQTPNPFFKPSLGIVYYLPFENQRPCFGPELTLSFSKFITGISYLKGQNTINTLSLGTYTRIPTYGAVRLPIYSNAFHIILGGGYSFNTNTLDPQIKSFLASQGQSQAKETVSSSPFVLIGMDYTSTNHGIFRLSYWYDNTTAISSNENFSNQAPISLHALSFSMLF